MKRITLTYEGSARVETDVPEDTMSSSGFVTPYRLWILKDGSTEQLAYVRRTMRTNEGQAVPVYMLSDRRGTKELSPKQWRETKARAKETDAKAEAGAEGVQLIYAALRGRLRYSEAVRQIENRRLQTDA